MMPTQTETFSPSVQSEGHRTAFDNISGGVYFLFFFYLHY